MNDSTLRDFAADMRLASLSPVTIEDRLALIHRLADYLLPVALIAATAEQLAQFQRQFAPLAPASVDIYVRHIQAFYRWARIRNLITVDPATELIRPKVRRGRPHPTSLSDLRTVFACTSGPLRIAYILATFAGLRRGEICRLQRADIDMTAPLVTARLDGKGGKERTVPLVAPIVAELLNYGMPPRGWIVTLHGAPYELERMSIDSGRHLRSIGVQSTLHSMRHAFATTAYRTSHDLLLVAELLGHESVATTQIYAAPDMADAHARLFGVSALATDVLAGGTPLRAVV